MKTALAILFVFARVALICFLFVWMSWSPILQAFVVISGISMVGADLLMVSFIVFAWILNLIFPAKKESQ